MRRRATPPGVVTGRYGTIGEVFYVDEPYWPLNTALYVIDFKGNNPRFIAYFTTQHIFETIRLKRRLFLVLIATYFTR